MVAGQPWVARVAKPVSTVEPMVDSASRTRTPSGPGVAQEEAGSPHVRNVPHGVHTGLGGLAQPEGAVEEQDGADDEGRAAAFAGCGSPIAAGCR